MATLAIGAVVSCLALLVAAWLFQRLRRPPAPLAGVRDAPAFRGLVLSVERTSFSWSEAASRDWPAGEPSHLPHPKLVVQIRYALEPAALRASGERARTALDRIALQASPADGGKGLPAQTLLALRRSAFFTRTGVHPSWAERMLGPDDGGDELISGELEVDYGHAIPRPQGPLALELSASLGPYRSNAVRIEVWP